MGDEYGSVFNEPAAAIGRRFGPYVGRVDATRLIRFAEVTGEIRPEYRDREAARAAGWRDIPAPPTYLFCLQMLDTHDEMGWARELGLPLNRLLHAEQSFVYHAPICAGDIITCEIEVVNIEVKKNGTLFFIECLLTGRNAEGLLVGEGRELLVCPRQ